MVDDDLDGMTVEEFCAQLKEDEKFYEKLEEYTSLLTPIADMAILMDIPESVLRERLRDSTSHASAIYRKARALAALRMRRNIMQLAEAGSPTAFEAMKNLYKDSVNDTP